MNKQQAYKEKAGAELDLIGAEVSRLKAMAAHAKAEQRDKLAGYLGDLEQSRRELGKKLESIKDSSGEALDDLRRGLKDAWDRLEVAKKAANARFH